MLQLLQTYAISNAPKLRGMIMFDPMILTLLPHLSPKVLFVINQWYLKLDACKKKMLQNQFLSDLLIVMKSQYENTQI